MQMSQPIVIADLLLSWISLALTLLAYLFGWDGANTAGFDLPEIALPFKVVILVVAAALLGSGLGYALNVMSKRDRTETRVVCLLATGIWALMLVGVADGLSSQDDRAEFLLFVLIGLGLMLWLLTFQLRADARMVSAPVMRDRSQFMFVFTSVVILSVPFLI